MLTRQDLTAFAAGDHSRLYDVMGLHLDGGAARASVWAPGATAVSVVGEMNDWRPGASPLTRADDESGIWYGVVEGAAAGQRYKFHLHLADGAEADKSDPFAFATEPAAGGNASMLWRSSHRWGDQQWMASRQDRNGLSRPISIYEMHLGSWRRNGEEVTYRSVAEPLAEYVGAHGFTHVELLPIMEHPFYGSWGYQTTGYFAPTSRYGSPDDLMALIDHLHRNDIGVLLDWVPSHFPDDPYGLARFDGTPLFEYADPRLGRHPDWNSLVFDYGRPQVRSFLLSSACYWLDRFHADGLRVDAVASMLYRDFSRQPGEWIPNSQGGRENFEAIQFLQRVNEVVYERFPTVQTIAEESTAWPGVTRPTYAAGLGFGFKWDMGWMHDTLHHLARPPEQRPWNQHELTFRSSYAATENFVLAFSHDEVVHGKGSLLGKLPGDDWAKRASLRLLYGYQWTTPGKKSLFMGSEFGSGREWAHDEELPWWLADRPEHAGIALWVGDLNRLYRSTPALYEGDHGPDGLRWLQANDNDRAVLAYARRGESPHDVAIVVANFANQVWRNHRIGVPSGGRWREALNSDSTIYGGSGQGNLGAVEAAPLPYHGYPYSLSLTLPPLATVIFRPPRSP